jgi:TolB-like protein
MGESGQQGAAGHGEGPAYASLFGRFAFKASDGTEIVISNRRVRALLAMLCLVPDEPLERDYLSELLWPGRFKSHAKASLRQCLLELGKSFGSGGQDIVEVTRSRVSLHAAAVSTDLGELERALKAGDYEDAARQLAAIGTAPLLEHMEFGDAFADWLARHRAKAEQRLEAAIARGLAALTSTGNQELHDRLETSWRQRNPSGPSVSADVRVAGKTPIAVLPFRSASLSGDQDYFTDGMVDELITALSGLTELQVAGRTSSFHFRDSTMTPAQIAAELGVSHLVEGSVQRQSERVRIHVHLIEGKSGFELWGSRFDGVLDDIFGLQEAVARGVAEALASALGIALQSPVVGNLTQSKEAYDLYLQGRSLGSRIFGEGVLENAIHFLEQAVTIDPLFAEAWVELAEAHHNVAVYTQCLDRNAAATRMADCAHKAIALSPGLGYPYALLGTYEWTRNNLVGGLDYAFEAYAREPSHPGVAMRVASFLLYCGRTSDAVPYVQAAIDRDPVDPRKYALLWSVHFSQGELAEALKAGQRIVDLGWPSMYLAVTSAALGQHDLAIAQYQQTKQLVNTIILPPVGSGTMTDEAMDAYWLMAAKGVCSGEEADRQTYHQVLEMMHAMLPDKADLAITAPAIFTGNAELVFKAFGHHLTPANILSLVSLWADIEPICRIWRHEEFIPFAQRIGLVEAWDKYGWPDLMPRPTNRLPGAD